MSIHRATIAIDSGPSLSVSAGRVVKHARIVQDAFKLVDMALQPGALSRGGRVRLNDLQTVPFAAASSR